MFDVFTLSLLAMVLALLLQVYVQQHENHRLRARELGEVVVPLTHMTHVDVPVRRDGVILVTDGAKGHAREVATELAKHGFHVLVGVRSTAELRSFAFEARKGLEPVLFDLTQPATFADIVYRIRQIRRDLDRPLVGVLLNLAAYVEDYDGEENANFLDISFLDRHYKAVFKGPVRLLQALFELLRHQDSEAKAQQGRLLEAAQEAQEGSNATRVNTLNTQGLRITTLYSVLPAGQADSCGARCSMQRAFLQYAEDFAAAPLGYTNFTTSQVCIGITAKGGAGLGHGSGGSVSGGSGGSPDLTSPRAEKAYEQSALLRRLQVIEATARQHVDWALSSSGGGGDGSMGSGGKGSGGGGGDSEGGLELPLAPGRDRRGGRPGEQLSSAARALLHSFLSPQPHSTYNATV